MGQFLFIDSFNLYSSSKLLVSDSENAFLFFENLFRVICLCLLIIFFLLFVVLFECIQLFVYVGLLQDHIFGFLFHNCVKRLFVYFLNF